MWKKHVWIHLLFINKIEPFLCTSSDKMEGVSKEGVSAGCRATCFLLSLVKEYSLLALYGQDQLVCEDLAGCLAVIFLLLWISS